MAVLCVAAPASAARADSDVLRRLAEPWSLSKPYLGVGAMTTHHTGHVPARSFGLEQWEFSQKAFAGTWFSPVFAGEITYYRLGEAATLPADVVSATVQAHAVSATLLAHHRLGDTPWVGRLLPDNATLFGKAGAAYKWMDQSVSPGTSGSESGPTHVLGFGLQYTFANGLFARAEYEYIGKVGGLQHTPVSVSVGMQF